MCPCLAKFSFVSLLLTALSLAADQQWNYQKQGPDVWSDTYPACKGHAQSPIVIHTACTQYQPFVPFRFSSTYDATRTFTLTNDGHTITGKPKGSDSSPFKLTGGGLTGTFEFVNFHLHWGENYKSGSEHQVDDRKYTGEIHFVHKNPDTSQLAVLGFFMQSDPASDINGALHTRLPTNDLPSSDNRTRSEWKKFFADAKNLEEVSQSTYVSLNLAALIGRDLDDFWRYEGSLTTPPCTEGVIWTVFTTPIACREQDIDAFREKVFSQDYRGPQLLHNRTVYRNYPIESASPLSDYRCCSSNDSSRLYKRFVLGPLHLLMYSCLHLIIFSRR